ncbi:nucleolar and spindle-associated protein 1 isoform X3 [Varanus komodoensis]|uniref:nucleolar and spindle-associated protein 1 isoform X3 n=1 Tax=Varanus komodoensis TaxID=61221 RepID=UPI001CF78628|nr:nucleolar and spindle-associated protein 1 isoform X3 [Varanus komodoensis]
MEVSSPQDLETLKYADLQRLAKTAGLRANLKADKLLTMLKQHFFKPIQEKENVDNKRASFSSTDTEECNTNQIPVNLSMVTKRCKNQENDNAQNHAIERQNINDKEAEVHPEKEILTELEEREETWDHGSGNELTITQNKCPANCRMTENLTENFATPNLENGKNSTRQKRVGNKTGMDSLSGKKPGLTNSLSKSARARIACTTPNFKKLHEAQFKKMLSIDDYIERKNKMIQNFNAVNEGKMLAKKSSYLNSPQNEILNIGSKVRTHSSGLLSSPHPQRNMLSATCTPVNLRHSPRNSLGTANKGILSQKSALGSTGCSTIKMNVRFSGSTKDNEHKRSLIKTPSRKSPFLNDGTPVSKNSNTSVTKKGVKRSATKGQLRETPTNSAVSSFKLVTQTPESTSIKKPAFDLQASLARPLSYQPHRGKLKPWGKSKENHQNACSHKKNYKQPLLQTREERRERHTQERKQRKDQVLGTYRGLRVV